MGAAMTSGKPAMWAFAGGAVAGFLPVMVFELIWDGLFDGRLDDKDHVIDVYLKHNQTVKDEVSPEKLLVFNSAQGWAPLCEFLEVPVPDEPYPKTNTSEDFAKMMAANRARLE
jgi:hypothetical protein